MRKLDKKVVDTPNECRTCGQSISLLFSKLFSLLEVFKKPTLCTTAISPKKEERNCLFCGKYFVTYLCQDKIYCSRQCTFDHHSAILNPMGKSPRRKRQKVIIEEAPLVAENATTPPPIAALPLTVPDASWTLEQKKARIKALSQW